MEEREIGGWWWRRSRGLTRNRDGSDNDGASAIAVFIFLKSGCARRSASQSAQYSHCVRSCITKYPISSGNERQNRTVHGSCEHAIKPSLIVILGLPDCVGGGRHDFAQIVDGSGGKLRKAQVQLRNEGLRVSVFAFRTISKNSRSSLG